MEEVVGEEEADDNESKHYSEEDKEKGKIKNFRISRATRHKLKGIEAVQYIRTYLVNHFYLLRVLL